MNGKNKIRAALAGNPNSGKTTIFNNLTGGRQHVGNYPGVTVEKIEGVRHYNGHELNLVDLPGTYSLTAYSPEELVARHYLIEEHPDVVINIVDASNLERNLFLTTQLIELRVPLIVVLNMSDIARNRGIRIDYQRMAALLGAPVVPTVGNKSEGMTELLDRVVEVAEQRFSHPEIVIHFGDEIEEELQKLETLLFREKAVPSKYDDNTRWVAVKLLENDKEVKQIISSELVIHTAKQSRDHLEKMFNEAPELVIAGRRYGFISGACQESVTSTVEARHTRSDQIDRVLLSPLLGLPIFLALMYLVFQLTFTLGKPPMELIEQLFGWLGKTLSGFWSPGVDSPLKSLIVDGIIGGVGGVIVFLPNILMLFLAISILEDTGYIARAAFLMDRFMHKIGLHGKSFIPMLIGFGCSIPAIMATRTLENRKDRITTMLVIPFMSCGARLPIYALIIPAFFPQQWNAPMLFSIYLIGILLAILSVKILRSTLLRGESTPFVIELPPYRVPTIKSTLIHMWMRGWFYLRKAGTIILGFAILMWALTYFPRKTEFDIDTAPGAAAMTTLEIRNARAAETLRHSVAGRVGRALEPALKPLGFDWKIGTALLCAFPAKELFVAQMGVIYSIGEGEQVSKTLRTSLRAHYTPLTGFCIILFCLIAMPCMATFAVVTRESGSWKWALFQSAYMTGLAYILVLIVHQAGILLHIGV